MTIVYDRRWDGPHGIGRFSAELRSRLEGDVRDLHGAHPVSPRGLVEIELLPHLRAPRDALLLSPGYCPSLSWPGLSAITVHDLIHLRVEGERSRGKTLYYEQVVRRAVRRPRTLVLTVSDFSKRDLLEWSGIPDERVVVVGNGVDPRFSPQGVAMSRARPYILHVGNTRPHKNLPALLRALTQLDGGVDLVLSARPDEALLSLAGRLGITRRVEFLGGIPEVDLPAWYRGAAAVAIISHYEGFGLPAIEGMASGVPVVAAGSSALAEVVGDGGVLVDPDDVDSIADALSRAVGDDALRASLGRSGPARAAQFSWDAVASRVRDQVGEWL